MAKIEDFDELDAALDALDTATQNAWQLAHQNSKVEHKPDRQGAPWQFAKRYHRLVKIAKQLSRLTAPPRRLVDEEDVRPLSQLNQEEP